MRAPDLWISDSGSTPWKRIHPSAGEGSHLHFPGDRAQRLRIGSWSQASPGPSPAARADQLCKCQFAHLESGHVDTNLQGCDGDCMGQCLYSRPCGGQCSNRTMSVQPSLPGGVQGTRYVPCSRFRNALQLKKQKLFDFIELSLSPTDWPQKSFP